MYFRNTRSAKWCTQKGNYYSIGFAIMDGCKLRKNDEYNSDK
jgi:hypothetical protein